jgi:hypothetical protein
MVNFIHSVSSILSCLCFRKQTVFFLIFLYYLNVLCTEQNYLEIIW